MSSPLLFRMVGFDFAAAQNRPVAAVQSHLVAAVAGYIAVAALAVAFVAGYYHAYQKPAP